MLPSRSRAFGPLSAGLGILALALALASVWPGAGVPPWPAGSVALLALALAWIPSSVVPRALGSIAGVLALGLATLETAVLWGLAGVMPS